MQALDNNYTLPFGSMVPEPAAHQQGSQFSGRATTISHATRQVESNRSFDETPSLADRLIYPFYAAKNRLLKMAGLGAHAGYFSPILSAGVVCGTVGGVIGSTVGNLIKCLFFPNSDESAGSAGFYVGFYAGSLLAVPAGVALGVVAAAAFAVIGLAGSVVTLPVDIYHAITLDNKADLHPDPVRVMDILNEIRHTEISDFFSSE